IAVDGNGSAYVTGLTWSTDFPTTTGALLRTLPGVAGSAFVAKLNPSGSALLYSTYLGGSTSTYADQGNGIAADGAGNVYVTGIANSNNFPVTTGALQTTYGGGSGTNSGDAFVTKLNASGSALLYSTYLGGINGDSGYAIAIDNSGEAYVTGI